MKKNIFGLLAIAAFFFVAGCGGGTGSGGGGDNNERVMTIAHFIFKNNGQNVKITGKVEIVDINGDIIISVIFPNVEKIKLVFGLKESTTAFIRVDLREPPIKGSSPIFSVIKGQDNEDNPMTIDLSQLIK